MYLMIEELKMVVVFNVCVCVTPYHLLSAICAVFIVISVKTNLYVR